MLIECWNNIPNEIISNIIIACDIPLSAQDWAWIRWASSDAYRKYFSSQMYLVYAAKALNASGNYSYNIKYNYFQVNIIWISPPFQYHILFAINKRYFHCNFFISSWELEIHIRQLGAGSRLHLSKSIHQWNDEIDIWTFPISENIHYYLLHWFTKGIWVRNVI